MQSLDIVIVTYNRLEKLKKALECYSNQTRTFRNIIIVDNCSTDGTKDYLDEWGKDKQTPYNKIIIHTDENLGGSGGFYLGQKKAMEMNADWIFVADDDAYADKTMVAEFYKYIDSHDTSKISVVCAEVLNMDGSVCLYHRDYVKIENRQFIRASSKIEDYQKPEFEINLLSYVGSFLNGQALKKVGLVNPKYFIYFDDSEHSLRLKKFGNMIVVPAIEITHDGGAELDQSKSKIMVSWRDYYMIRNYEHMLLKHFPKIGLYKLLEDFIGEVVRIVKRNPLTPYMKIENVAMLDAFIGRLGKHNIYRPGWQIMKATEKNTKANNEY